MPFRLLVWNIQFFTKKRIANTKPTNTVADLAEEQRAIANLMYIVNVVKQSDPDVFIILEARSGQGKIEELANGKGPPGLVELLSYMRALNSNWYLVPPLRVNPKAVEGVTYTETVGVFWRSDRLTFTGPYVWPQAAADTGPPVPYTFGVATAPYPGDWAKVVPTGTVAAPRCQFTSYFGEDIILADPDKYSQYARRPLLTTFKELAGQKRGINLFSVHTKPSQALAALIQMNKMKGEDWFPADDDVTVFAGDFNVDIRNLEKLSGIDRDRLRTFQGKRKQLPFYKPNGGLPPSVIYSNREAEPTAYLKAQLYDYGFVTYGANVVPPQPPAVSAVIIDSVAGVTPGNSLPTYASDMRQKPTDISQVAATKKVAIVAAPNGAARQGGVTTVTTAAAHGLSVGDRVTVAGMRKTSFNGNFFVATAPDATHFTYAQADKPNLAGGGGGTVDVLPRLNAFRQRWNYGHISPPGDGVSDHLPVFMLI